MKESKDSSHLLKYLENSKEVPKRPHLRCVNEIDLKSESSKELIRQMTEEVLERHKSTFEKLSDM